MYTCSELEIKIWIHQNQWRQSQEEISQNLLWFGFFFMRSQCKHGFNYQNFFHTIRDSRRSFNSTEQFTLRKIFENTGFHWPRILPYKDRITYMGLRKLVFSGILRCVKIDDINVMNFNDLDLVSWKHLGIQSRWFIRRC